MRFWLVLTLFFLPACGPEQQHWPTESQVKRVIDGDTIELTTGERVRYLGIDTPEVRVRIGKEWVESPEPFALEASDSNKQWVAGRNVRLEYDVRKQDKYGRLLAYVYVADTMVNEALLKDGLATVLIVPPNVRYADKFRELADQARRERKGLWNYSNAFSGVEL